MKNAIYTYMSALKLYILFWAIEADAGAMEAGWGLILEQRTLNMVFAFGIKQNKYAMYLTVLCTED
jgi:hypothetical protein